MNRQAGYWIATGMFLLLVLSKFSPETGFTGLIRFGEKWQPQRLSSLQKTPLATMPETAGYDGQFYAQIALDPLLRNRELDQAIDSPAYRARRILIPMTAAALGLGNPWWTLQAYALINVFCWCALGWLLHRQIDPEDRFAFARWTGCMFSMGVLESTRLALVDLPALLLLTLAALASAKHRPSRIPLWLALANLAKETSVLGTLALYGGKSALTFSWRRVGLGLIAALLPLGIWSLYVQQRFTGVTGGEGLGNFTWPFFGLLSQAKYSLRELSLGNFDSRYSFSLIAMMGFGVQTWVIWRSPQPPSAWWRLGAAYSILLVLLSSWVWSGYWAACRAVLPTTIAFNLLLPATRIFWPLWILGNLTMLHAVWRFL